jgi:hypothetical protein
MRLTGFKAKSRFTVAMSAAIAAFIVSACGGSNATITVASTGNGAGVWGVITTDSTAMAVIKKAEGATSNVTVQDGDQHMGNHVCGYNVSKNGHSYQVDYYTSSSLAESLLTSQCASTAQQQFLTEAP